MSYRLAVIGSNSFSGSHLVAHALGEGAEVLGVSRSAEPHVAFLPYRWRACRGSFSFVQADLNTALDAAADALNRFEPEYVVNFASQGMVAQSWDAPVDWFRTNVLAQVALHDALRKTSYLKTYVHVGTPEVYGNCEGAVTEDHAFRPSTPYAVSRAACEMSLRTFLQRYDFPVVTTRAANVYGPGQQLYRIIPRTVLSIRLGRKLPLQGGGASVRSFIHIRDVVEGTMLAAVHGRPGDCFHLATRNSLSIRALVERICSRMGAPFESTVEIADERPGKDHAYLLDTTAARARLKWSDTIDLDRGIDETIAWIDANLESLRNHPLEYVHKA